MVRRRQQKKSKKSAFKLILLLVTVICIGILARQEYQIYQIRQEKEATQQRVEQMEKKNSALETEKQNLQNPGYIEKLAREEYNMVKKNEIPVFIVENEKDKDKPQENK